MESYLQMASLLNALANRAQSSDTPDLSPAIGIVNDLARFITQGSELQIRRCQAATGAVNEQIIDGTCAYDMLTGPDNHVFLAGALWAVCEIMSVKLDDFNVRLNQEDS